MKFLLAAINAKYIHSNPAVYSLRAYAGKELQSHVELAEYTINQQLQDILADIYCRKPDVIGVSCYIWNWKLVQELLTELPKLLPDVDIWLGGPEVTYDGPEILCRYPQLSGIMVGEGEETFRELLEYYVRKSSDVADEKSENKKIHEDNEGLKDNTQKCLMDIPGLCLATGYTPPRELLDMNQVPFLYDNLEPFTNKIIYYESSRGCP